MPRSPSMYFPRLGPRLESGDPQVILDDNWEHPNSNYLGIRRPAYYTFYIYPLVISHSYGKSLFSMGKLTVSVAIFDDYVKLPEA